MCDSRKNTSPYPFGSKYGSGSWIRRATGARCCCPSLVATLPLSSSAASAAFAAFAATPAPAAPAPAPPARRRPLLSRGGGFKPLAIPHFAPPSPPPCRDPQVPPPPTCHAIYHTIPYHVLRRRPTTRRARWSHCPLACQATWSYVLCLCVRHGPHASQARWLHGFRPGVDPGYGDSEPCLCERGTRCTSRA